nr:hypothetical protein [Tanacetum cinerariifolium]
MEAIEKSTNNTSNTNKADNTAYGVIIAHTQDEQVKSESVDVVSTVSSSALKTVESVDVKNKGVCSTIETKPVKKNNFSPPIIEDWISNDESEVEFEPKFEDKNV